MPHESDLKILTLFDLFVQSSPPTRKAIEEKLGQEFSRSGGQDAPFVIGNAHLEETELSDVTLIEGGKATVARLSADIGGTCISSETILARYGFDSVRTPSGHSSAELTYWRRNTKGGQVSFGFDQGAANCLKSIVFDASS